MSSALRPPSGGLRVGHPPSVVATIHGIVAFINGLGLPWAAEVEKDFGRPAPYGELFSTEGITVPHLFTGKELDPETGFYFYEARYYDPELGRFLTPDSIVPNWTDPQDFNRYTYAANNPLKYTDPTGHFKFWKKFKSFFKKAAGILIGAIVTVATWGWGAPVALAWGGFFGGFGGTLINGGSIGQAFGMGIVGAFAGGVGGVAFQGLGGIARIAAMTAIGATAGASGAAIMGGNIGLGALAGGAAGFIGGAVGGRLADSWKPGLARIGAGIAAAAGGGAASSAIAGGSPGTGAALGAFGAVIVAVASGNLQQAVDGGRAKAGPAADRSIVHKIHETNKVLWFEQSGTSTGTVAISTTTSTNSALTPDMALGLGGLAARAFGFKGTSLALGTGSRVLNTGGNFEVAGSIILGTAGVVAGGAFGEAVAGPWGARIGIMGGGYIFGRLGATGGRVLDEVFSSSLEE